MQQEEEQLVDPEEQTERKLVHSMALAIVAIIAGAILFLAIRPWIQRFREESQEQDSDDTLIENAGAAAAEDRPSGESSTS